MTLCRALTAVLLAWSIAGGAAQAQESRTARISADTVVSVSMLSGNDQPGAMFDATARVDVGRGVSLIIRPWAWRRPEGTWSKQWYQLQVRYQTRTEIPLRFDAGIITSPIGLNTLQMRADLNPTVSPVFYYVVPLPRFEATFDRLNAITAGYPLGAMVSASGTRWDLRGGVLDSTPARPRAAWRSDQPPVMAQAVLGGGITPVAGFRIGAGFTHGGYRRATATAPAASATVFNIEAEYAFDQTRLSAELVQDRFRAAPDTYIARSFYAQAVQTITPRLFGAGRVARTKAPPFFVSGIEADRMTVELTAGYRLTTDWTFRGGYLRERPYLATDWDHQATVSVVWAKRWY